MDDAALQALIGPVQKTGEGRRWMGCGCRALRPFQPAKKTSPPRVRGDDVVSSGYFAAAIAVLAATTGSSTALAPPAPCITEMVAF